MDDVQFDELTKKLAAPVSRRHAMKLFAATAATSVAGLAGGAGEAAAGRCFKLKHPCRQNYECCSFYCNPSTGHCQCPPGSNVCSKTGICVSCPSNSTFNPDTCHCDCDTGTTVCGDQCCSEGQTCCRSSYGYFFCSSYGGC